MIVYYSNAFAVYRICEGSISYKLFKDHDNLCCRPLKTHLPTFEYSSPEQLLNDMCKICQLHEMHE